MLSHKLGIFRVAFLGLLVLIFITLWSCGSSNKEPQPNDTYELKAPNYFGVYTLPADNALTRSGVNLGRHLFYEKKLSLDNSLSCGSCHKQEFAFSDTAAISIGVNGAKGRRQSMALSNLLWQKSFFWDGRSVTLEDQALSPITDAHELQESLDNVVLKLKADPMYPPMFTAAFGSGEITSSKIAKALAQFERTLISANSKYDQYLLGNYVPSASEKNGMNLFFTHPDPGLGIRGGNCGDCHSGKLQQSAEFRNNGLDSDASFTDLGLEEQTKRAIDKGRFKIPSLRNITLSAPYMHDGRFKTLEQVVDHYNEHIKESSTLDPLIINASNEFNGKLLKLTTSEKQDIVNFLKMLTDEEFINNKEFSDPFVR